MPARIPEIPDDAPFSPEQREWLKQYLESFAASLVIEHSAADPGATGGARIVIMFGSQSGNAQSLSEGFAQRLEEAGYAPAVVDMENFGEIDLTEESILLIATSTWGEGDPPDNAITFWETLSGEEYPRLENLRFSVLALGDTNYVDFCQMGKNFDARLEELGAKRFAPRIDCDVDYDDPAEEWFRVVLSELDRMDLKPAPAPSVRGGAAAAKAKPAVEDGYSKKNPFPATVLRNQRLNLDGSEKDTRHIELSLNGSGYTYEVGDVLGVVPLNCPDLVDEIIKALPFNTSVNVSVPDGRTVPLRDALLECCDLRTINKKLLTEWSALSGSPYLKAVVEAGDADFLSDFIHGLEVIDLVVDYPADFRSAQDFVNILRKLNPRLYSIASSPKAHPGEVHLTVAKVEYHSKYRSRKGVCSTYLSDRVDLGDQVKVFVQSAKHFKLPENGDAPVIMVGPGTGIAPFRAFLEERKATGAKGGNWLFFGNPHEASDFFYKDEFEALIDEGVLTRLDVAWSRDQGHKVYVQNKMVEASEELWKWVDKGAHFYVCGDAARMAPDVDKALHDLIAKYGNMSEEAAAEYVAQMKKDKRYQRDVY